MMKPRVRNTKNSEKATVEEISEAEQWRIINESGVLKAKEISPPEPSDIADEILNAILLIIPFSFLYLMMDIKYPPPRDFVGRLISAIPILSVFIFYSASYSSYSSNVKAIPVANRHKSKSWTQIGLFLACLTAGTRLIWLVNRASWYVVMRQGPPLATIWIFTITLLDLIPAVFGLALIGVWFWWTGMKLYF